MILLESKHHRTFLDQRTIINTWKLQKRKKVLEARDVDAHVNDNDDHKINLH